MLVFFSLLTACASGPETRIGSEPPPPEDSKAAAASYGADGFTYGKKMRVRYPNDFFFFFKHCDLTGDRAYYSMHSYGCSYP